MKGMKTNGVCTVQAERVPVKIVAKAKDKFGENVRIRVIAGLWLVSRLSDEECTTVAREVRAALGE